MCVSHMVDYVRKQVLEMVIFCWSREKIEHRMRVQHLTFSFMCLTSRRGGFTEKIRTAF